MKKNRKLSAKILSLALAAAMVVAATPETAFALETKRMPESTPVHDENCGYIAAADGTPCTHLNEDGSYSCAPSDADKAYACPHDDECGYAQAVKGTPCTPECELFKPDTPESTAKQAPVPECSCTVKCNPADKENDIEAAINAECPVCGIANADFGKCIGEEPLALAAPKAIVKRTRQLDLYNHADAPVDNAGTPLSSTDGVFDMLSSEGWKWDSNTHTLTLNGADIETQNTYALYLPKSINIIVEGENFLNTIGTSSIHTDGDLNIGGSGSLDIGSVIKSNNVVVCNGDLAITGGTIKISSANTDDNNTGIWTKYNINISGGDLTVEGIISENGNISVNSAKVNSFSSTGNAISTYAGTLTFQNSEVEIEAKSDYSSLYSSGDLLIDASTVKATTTESNAIYTDGALTISGNSDVTAAGKWCGLNAQGSGITISGGKINATSTNDSAVFTKGTLNISGDADVTATGGKYCGLQANGNITIGDSIINAKSPKDSAIYSETALLINGNADVTATGSLRGLQSADVQIAGNAKVTAISENDNAITGKANLSITENAEVDATGYQSGVLSEKALTLSCKKVIAHGEANDGIFSWYNDIYINGAVTATSNQGYGIRSMYGTITADSKADISATGTWAGIHSNSGNVTFTGSNIESAGTSGDGIYSAGTIRIDGGNVHAKGADGYVAIRAKAVQTAGETASSQINLTNMIEKNDGKVAFCDWYDYNGNQTSWTTFIAKDDPTLVSNGTGGIDNGLKEVWLSSPYTVTFDVNGGSGIDSTSEVYPGNSVTAPAADPTKAGCHFSGWYLDDTKFDFTTPITGNIILKAKLDTHTANADDGDCTTAVTCSVCNEITTAAKTHNWDTAWVNDSSNHWHKCKNAGCTQTDSNGAHTFGEWAVDKAATETEKGAKHRDCSVCAYTEAVETPVLPHTHAPSPEWSKDTNTHWHSCTANDGERMDETAHTWNDGEITTPATITQKGVKTYTCTVCSQTKTESIPMLPSNSTIVDNSTGTTAVYVDGSPFDSSIVLSVTSKPQTEMDKFKDSVNKTAPGFTLGGLYEVKLLKDGLAIQPNGKIKISIPLTDAMKSMTNLQIVYLDDNGNVTVIPSEIKDGMIVFVSDHFSYYGVIGKVKAIDPGNNSGGSPNGNLNGNRNNGNSPKTGDNSSILLFVLMMASSGIAFVSLRKKRKIFKHMNK